MVRPTGDVIEKNFNVYPYNKEPLVSSLRQIGKRDNRKGERPKRNRTVLEGTESTKEREGGVEKSKTLNKIRNSKFNKFLWIYDVFW